MVALASPVSAGEFNQVLSVGDAAPAWKDLEGIDGKEHALADLKDKDVVVVAFICNSFATVQAYEDRINSFVEKNCGTKSKVAFVAINVNTIKEDLLPKMKERAAKKKFKFPYLYDPSQEIAKQFGAPLHAGVLRAEQGSQNRLHGRDGRQVERRGCESELPGPGAGGGVGRETGGEG